MYNTDRGEGASSQRFRGVLLLEVRKKINLSELPLLTGFIYLVTDIDIHVFLLSKDIPSILYDRGEDAIQFYNLPITGVLTDSSYEGVENVYLQKAERPQGGDKNVRKIRHAFNKQWWIATYFDRNVFCEQ